MLVQQHYFNIFLKKIILFNFKSAVTSSKKSEKFHALTFDNAWKTSFRAHLLFLSHKRFFPKKVD